LSGEITIEVLARRLVEPSWPTRPPCVCSLCFKAWRGNALRGGLIYCRHNRTLARFVSVTEWRILGDATPLDFELARELLEQA
jgi:hypothetical protein